MKRSSRQETYVAPRFLWDQLGDFMNIFSGFWGGGEGGSDDDDDDFRKCDLGSCGNFLYLSENIGKQFGNVITCSCEQFFKAIYLLQ